MERSAAPGRTDIPESEPHEEQREAASTDRVDAAWTPDAKDTGETDSLDFFIQKDGQVYAGTHLIIDLWEASRLDDPEHIETTLIRAAEDAGATVLSSDFHIFTPNNGVSGVIVLAESHISIHTWPERNFAALDVFMCGDAEPMKTIPRLKEAFGARQVTLHEIKRGLHA